MRRSALGCVRERVPEAAGSIAYFTLFSLFPLLVLLISTLSFVLEPPQARDKILSVILEAMPTVSHKLISANIDQVLQNRGAMSILGVLGLMWAASGVFGVLTANLSRAWPTIRTRNVLRMRGMSLAIIVGLFALLLAFLFAQTLLGLLAEREEALGVRVPISLAVQFASRGLAYVFSFLALLLMYRILPNTAVRWTEAAIGAISAFVTINMLGRALGWGIAAGLVRYNLVYGSLGSLVLLMFWTYAMSFAILWGSHVSAAIAGLTRPEGVAAD